MDGGNLCFSPTGSIFNYLGIPVVWANSRFLENLFGSERLPAPASIFDILHGAAAPASSDINKT